MTGAASDRRSDLLLRLRSHLITPERPLSSRRRSQQAADGERLIASFRTEWPDLYARLIGLERAHGVFYGALAAARGKVNEPEVFRLMLRAHGSERRRARVPIPKPTRATPRSALAQPRSSSAPTRSIAKCWRSSRGLDASSRAPALDAAVDRYLEPSRRGAAGRAEGHDDPLRPSVHVVRRRGLHATPRA